MKPVLSMLVFAAVAVSATAVAAADLSGKWTIDGDVQGNPVNLTCDVQQAADAKIAGKCQVNGMEPTELEGTVKDSAFKFSFTVQGYTLTYASFL